MTSTGQRLYDALLAHPFIHAMPRAWDTPRDTAIAALDALALKARDYATKPSARTMLEQFRLSFPGEEANWPVGSPIEDEYAWWLYTHGWAIAVSPEPEPSYIPDLPADQVQMSGLDYPEDTAGLGNFHERAMELLREWAHNDEDDVRDTLDAQATYLQERGAWVTDSCAALGHSKDFLGAVMRYKKARLDNARAMDSMPKRYRVIGESPSGNVNEAAPIGTLVQYAPEAGSIDSIIPCRVVRDTGGTIAGGGTGSAWWFRKENLEPAEWSLPQIGEFYTVVGDNPVASGYRHGDTVVIASLADCTYGRARWDVLRAGDPTGMFLHREHMSMQPVTPTPVQTSGLETVGEIIDAQVQPLQDEVTDLRARLEVAEQNYTNAQASHRNDLDIIARHFWEQAWRRGWCSEAEQVIEDINSETSINLEDDRDVYQPKEKYYPDLEVEVEWTDDAGRTWRADVIVEVECEGVSESDAHDSIGTTMVEAAVNAMPYLPGTDVKVNDWSIL